jgi:beta-fructofuranosidase
LIVCPQGVPHQELKYENHCLAGYFIGHFSVDSLDMIHGKFHELDKGFDFYSPQVIANDSRHILIGWIGMPDLTDTVESAKDGWLYTLTMPRELILHEGKLRYRPVEEMKALRKDFQSIDVFNTAQTSANLAKGSESELSIKFGAARKVQIAVKWGKEKFTMSYNRDTQIMTLDRSGMKLGGNGIRPFSDGKNTDVELSIRKFKLFANLDLQFRLFVDRSAIEVFLQNGEEACSMLIYPENDVAPVLEITGDKAIENISGKIFELAGLNYK